MPSYLEFEGKKVDMAIEKACNKLGITKENLKHEILSYGSTGIFGLVGAKKARIRVFLPEEKIEKNSENKKRDHHKNADQTENLQVKKSVSENLEAAADLGKEAIEKIVHTISPETVVSVRHENDKILFSITGGNAGVLIGKKGQTLDALHYLVEKIINKKAEERVRINIDVEGYLENRKESLRVLAAKLAEKAKKTKKPVTVGHLTANDRRIVHMALKKEKSLRTQSMGEGFVKKLVIFPKRKMVKKSNRKKNDQGSIKNDPSTNS